VKKLYQNLFIFILVCALLNSFIGSKAFAQDVQNFSFESFSADYYLGRSSDQGSTMTVDESLVADFPNYDQNHGILRAIPESYKGHTLSLKDIKVTDETGKPYQFSATDQNGNKVLKIGNPGAYVQGRTVYKISYKLQDVVGFYNDHDELFWDINGDQWDQPFGSVTATIHIGKQLTGSLQDRRLCYTGTFGSTEQNCSITLVAPPNETYVTASANNIGSRQTLSVVLAFKPGTFKLSSAAKKDQQRQKIELISAIALAAIPPLLASIFMFRRWRQFGNDPKGRGVIIPEYEPPKGFNPLSSDYLLKQQLRNNAVSATIIDLAINGYITIIEVQKTGFLSRGKDYKLVLNKTPEQDAPAEILKVLIIVFGDNLLPGTSMQLSDLKKNYSRQRQIYKLMQTLENSLAEDLAKNGYFIKNPKDVKNGYMIWGIVMFFGAWVVGWAAASTHFLPLWGLAVGLGLAGAIIFLFSFIMSARTEAGVQAHDDLLGLKEYIKLAEADRLKFLQSPDGAEKIADKDAFDPKNPEQKVKLFEKLLPYAMLFGLEKDWAKQFNDIYKTPPNWYQGGNWSAFNAGYLIGSLSDFNTASMQSFSSPSSSSGSGFSGGGAGGGGGGGGGGGW
jgi:uncharacterized membrane protein YgcG